MNIRTNYGSMNAQNQLRQTMGRLNETMESLSSAKRINEASDDASGLAITTRMTSKIKGNTKAIQNMQNIVELSNVADGGLANIEDQLQRMRELVIQAQNGTYNTKDIQNMQAEINNLLDSVETIANQTYYNGINLLNNGKMVYDADSTVGGGAIQNGTQTATIPAGGYQDFTYVVPPRDPQDGTKFELEVTKDDLQVEMLPLSGTINESFGPNDSASNTINIPDGYVIKNAKLHINAGGDLESSPHTHTNPLTGYNYTHYHDNEYIQTEVNGQNVHRAGGRYDGTSSIVDITNVTGVKGSESINIDSFTNSRVSSASISYRLEVEYELKGNIMDVYSSGSGGNVETFGDGEEYLDGTGFQQDYSNDASVAAEYTGGGTGGIEKYTFYNAEEGNWTVRVQNPSSTRPTRVEVKGQYQIATKIPVHNGAGESDREEVKLSSVVRDTLGIANLIANGDTSLQRLDAALTIVTKERAKYGAYMERFEKLGEHRNKEYVELNKAMSRIQDANMTKEISSMARDKVIQSSTMEMIKLHNMTPQNMLKVIQDL